MMEAEGETASTLIGAELEVASTYSILITARICGMQ